MKQSVERHDVIARNQKCARRTKLKHRELSILVYANTKKLHPDDRAISGVYDLIVPTDMSDSQQVSAAKDLFHDKIGIRVLDDFSIYVVERASGVVLVEDDEPSDGQEGEAADLEFDKSDLPKLYEVEATSSAGNKIAVLLVATDSKKQAKYEAFDMLCDRISDAEAMNAQYAVKRSR